MVKKHLTYAPIIDLTSRKETCGFNVFCGLQLNGEQYLTNDIDVVTCNRCIKQIFVDLDKYGEVRRLGM